MTTNGTILRWCHSPCKNLHCRPFWTTREDWCNSIKVHLKPRHRASQCPIFLVFCPTISCKIPSRKKWQMISWKTMLIPKFIRDIKLQNCSLNCSFWTKWSQSRVLVASKILKCARSLVTCHRYTLHSRTTMTCPRMPRAFKNGTITDRIKRDSCRNARRLTTS